jgi:hypothetical protein
LNYMDVFNTTITVLVVIAIIVSWQVYRMTRSQSILFILFANIGGLVNRILLYTGPPNVYTRSMSVVFWILWVLGLWSILRLLKKCTNQSNGGWWNTIKRWIGLK